MATFLSTRVFQKVIASGCLYTLEQWIKKTERYPDSRLRNADRGIRRDIETTRSMMKHSYRKARDCRR